MRPLHAAALDATNAESGQSTWPGRPDKQVAKNELLSWIEGTKRGSRATKLLRGQIEEAQVCVGHTGMAAVMAQGISCVRD